MTQLTHLQSRFLDLLLASGALKFGEFKTKSGRISPYFLNTGSFDNGSILNNVATCYSEFINQQFGAKVHLYGPAYKGITLAAATAMKLAELTNDEIPFTFNRKEKKEHGEGGVFVGRSVNSNSPLLIVEDVMTGGTSIRETMALLEPLKLQVRGVVIGVDRQERGEGQQLASKQVESAYGFPVKAILTMDDIVRALWDGENGISRQGKVWITSEICQKIVKYRSEWG